MSVGRSVSPSTRWLSDENSRTLGPRIMKLHRYIDHDSQMTPIDFEVTGSKVKVTMTPIDFEVNRSKVKVTCWNRIFKAFANSLDPDETSQNVASHQDPNYKDHYVIGKVDLV
ncbi:hypothetical protein DPMN_121737 [Dreissena polymorpha]|uniref:Uncharacterized protein n=1 Tax=Dreissena polymorpha TaxID=45954 RepID=A0A9D4JTF0_DREPO|nr:hypothetical protein DPMN_121737 [Dreissena polymorpha]